MGIIDNIKILSGKKQSTPPPVPTKKIVLIIEDEKALADALEIKLKDSGFNVIKAANGQVGIATIVRYKPDVVLLDLIMPIMDGKSMLHKLREIPEFEFLPVIVLTNAGEIDNMIQAKRDGDAYDFLIKANVSMEEIVRKVKEAA